MDRTRCRRSVLGLPKFGHDLDCTGTRHVMQFGSGVNMYKTVTLPLIYRSVKLDIRCFRDANKPAALHCYVVFRNTSGLETHLNGRVRVHLRNLI
jgi:hypothetical protein